jgi:hypothetical protein
MDSARFRAASLSDRGVSPLLRWGQAPRSVRPDEKGLLCMESDTFRGILRGPMSEENVELVRRLYKEVLAADSTFAASTADVLPQFFDPDVHLRQMNQIIGTVRDFHGYAGLAASSAEMAEALGEFEFIPDEIRAAGDKMLAIASGRGIGRSSGAPSIGTARIYSPSRRPGSLAWRSSITRRQRARRPASRSSAVDERRHFARDAGRRTSVTSRSPFRPCGTRTRRAAPRSPRSSAA